MLTVIKKLFRDEEGQGLAEYALILAGVAVVVMAVIWLLGDQIKTVFEEITTRLGGG